MISPSAFPDIFFPEGDCALLCSLTKSTESRLYYHDTYGFLFWSDERPDHLAYEIKQITNWQILQLHRTKLWYYPQLDLHAEFTAFEIALWKWALEKIPSWIGFSRPQ